MRRFLPLLLLLVVGCSSTTAPQAPQDNTNLERVTVPMMQRQYDRLCIAYNTGDAFVVYRPWALLDMILKAPPTVLRPCPAKGEAAIHDLGTQDGIGIRVYRTSCGDLYFRFSTPAREYLIGPGGWSAWYVKR